MRLIVLWCGPPPPEPRVGGSSASCQKPKMRKAAAVIHPLPPAHMAARDQRRRSPAESASASRSLVARKACRCSFFKSKEDAAATTACLLPRSLAISPPMLMALCFCLGSADHICLVRHRTIITDFAYVLADLPMSCAVPPVLLDRCAVFLRLLSFLEKTRSHRIAVPLAQQCDGGF
jgi:hypothetical protein